MTTRNHRHPEDVEKYGFRWGQLDVTRVGELYGQKWVSVQSDFGSVEIYVSKGGRSIRVFRGSEELK